MQRDFRMPREVVDKRFQRFGVVLILGYIVSALLLRNVTAGPSISTILLLAILLLGGRHLAITHVWVSLGPEGLSGRGYTGRKVVLRWQDEAISKRTRVSGSTGVEIRATNSAGPISSQVETIFVPDAILRLQEFKSVAQAYAPANHPLLSSAAAA